MRQLSDIEKMASYVSKHKRKCKHCGYPLFIIDNFKKNKILCHNCGRFVYKNDADEFKDKLKQQIRREEENDTYKD